jgi:hypothetical protein
MSRNSGWEASELSHSFMRCTFCGPAGDSCSLKTASRTTRSSCRRTPSLSTLTPGSVAHLPRIDTGDGDATGEDAQEAGPNCDFLQELYKPGPRHSSFVTPELVRSSLERLLKTIQADLDLLSDAIGEGSGDGDATGEDAQEAGPNCDFLQELYKPGPRQVGRPSPVSILRS